MTHPSFYSPSDCLPSIPPRRGHSAHGPHQSPCTDRGWALPSPPPQSLFTTPKAPKLRDDAEVWAGSLSSKTQPRWPWTVCLLSVSTQHGAGDHDFIAGPWHDGMVLPGLSRGRCVIAPAQCPPMQTDLHFRDVSA